MTLDQAKEALRVGEQFGNVFPQLTSTDLAADQAELRRFYCHDLPPRKREAGHSADRPTENGKPKANPKLTISTVHKTIDTIAGCTGEICPNCQGSNVMKKGTCSTCMDCGEPVGGCS